MYTFSYIMINVFLNLLKVFLCFFPTINYFIWSFCEFAPTDH